jgi:predicted RNA-binding Zn ribbon-like protein
MPLPPWVAPDEAKPAPKPLLLVQAFVNTYEADTGIDLLRESSSAERWFGSAGLLVAGTSLAPELLSDAREVRESLRRLLAVNAGAAPPTARELAPLAAIAQDSTLQLRIDGAGGVHLDPASAPGLRSAWLQLLLIIREAQADGTWPRLKSCQNHECGWAFYDRSRGRRGRWCDMAVCGNRMKNRSLRTRRRARSLS